MLITQTRRSSSLRHATHQVYYAFMLLFMIILHDQHFVALYVNCTKWLLHPGCASSLAASIALEELPLLHLSVISLPMKEGLQGDWTQVLYTAGPLLDGQGCGCGETDCCSPAGVRWFYKSVGSTTHYIEIRTCGDQQTSDEDTPTTLYEIVLK